MEVEEYITKTQLKQRGWTESIIQKLNIKPDKIIKNPAPTLLFSIIKIEKIEKSDDFIKLFNKSKRRKLGAQKAVETKTQKLLEYADSVEIKIHRMSDRYITKNAIDNYNWFNKKTGLDKVTIYSDINFLNRIKNNYVRHELTNYDLILKELKGKVGRDDAYHLIRNRIEERIDDELREMKYGGKR